MNSILSEKNFKLMRRIVQYWAPALITFILTLSSIWGGVLDDLAVPISATIGAIATLFGVRIGQSKKAYDAALKELQQAGFGYDGSLVVDQDAGGMFNARLEVGAPPEELAEKDEIKFNVHRIEVDDS